MYENILKIAINICHSNVYCVNPPEHKHLSNFSLIFFPRSAGNVRELNWFEHIYVFVNSSGLIYYKIRSDYSVTCGLDMTYFPFDTQTCNIDVATQELSSYDANLTRGTGTSADPELWENKNGFQLKACRPPRNTKIKKALRTDRKLFPFIWPHYWVILILTFNKHGSLEYNHLQVNVRQNMTSDLDLLALILKFDLGMVKMCQQTKNKVPTFCSSNVIAWTDRQIGTNTDKTEIISYLRMIEINITHLHF